MTTFFESLSRLGVSYVVLRWFDNLPQVDPDEDIDMLVADEDLETVRGLLVTRPPSTTRQKFDVYSVGGLPGSAFLDLAYYPPPFARAILGDAVLLRGLYRVPSTKHHFDSLAFHAVYHKGYASGLGGGDRRERGPGPADHDYGQSLGKLATELGTQVALTLEGLDVYLHSENLRPPMDTLERLRVRNPWIHERFFTGQPLLDPVWRGLAVFVVRERAEQRVAAASEELAREGFEVLEVLHLEPVQREMVSERIRGGNWGRGPFPTSGGGPSVFVVAYDAAPIFSPDDGGTMTNLRIPRAKEGLRRSLLSGVDPTAVHNPVHSSDNPRQALDYLDALADPAVVERTRARAGRAQAGVAFPYPVLHAFSTHARRAQVAVVEHPIHGRAVCKLFRPTAVRFFERELRARTELSSVPEVPELLESGDNWLLTRLYTDDRSHVRRGLPGRNDVQLHLRTSRALVRFAEALHVRGLFILDLSTQNLVSDPVAGLKVLDLEFLQEYAEPRPPLARSYTFRGAPGSHYDKPQLRPRALITDSVGNAVFHPAVSGTSVAALLRGPRPGQGLRHRSVQRAWYAYFLCQMRYRAVKAPVRASRWGRRYAKARWLLTGRSLRV